MMINISMKFHEDILNGLKVTERIQFCYRNCYLQSSKGYNSKYIYPRVTVFVLCTSSNVGYLERFSSYRADGIVFCSWHSQFFSSREITSSRPKSVTKSGFLYIHFDQLS